MINSRNASDLCLLAAVFLPMSWLTNGMVSVAAADNVTALSRTTIDLFTSLPSLTLDVPGQSNARSEVGGQHVLNSKTNSEATFMPMSRKPSNQTTPPTTKQSKQAMLTPSISLEQTRALANTPTNHPRRRSHKLTRKRKRDTSTVHDYGTVTFYVVADSPYYPADARRLKNQMKTMPKDAEFVIHLGDIRSAASGARCVASDYSKVAKIFSQSHAPVFLVLGDNDWNDCPNPAQGLKYWNRNFLNLWDRFWNCKYAVTHMDAYPQNYYWVAKGTLFVGLDLPGSDYIFDMKSWNQQLAAEATWTISQIKRYKKQMNRQGLVGQVVLFAQANPTKWHQPFFKPLVGFIQKELKNQMPILYMNGDTHVWNYTPSFMGQKSFLRINLTGETINPPLKITINGSNTRQIQASKLFKYDRQLK